ncbi:MAG: MBL fold metallo-hydrolase [Caldisericia bacterium]|jgi:predicted metallo-beta-lactamase superfamily hydrolase|nr:MBL fold metallo-hydrolase [Caldisericia bacterium]
MKIFPIAGETLGVRSTSVFVQTENLKILIDPGFSIPQIKNLFPPTPYEFRAADKIKKILKEKAMECDLIIITHYHMDHFSYYEDFYKNKIVFIKDPENYISENQKERAKKLLNILEKNSKNFHIANGEINFGKTKIKFSKIFPHGVDEKMGGVISVLIDDGEKLIYSSDISGFSSENSESFVIDEKPDILIFDGPVSEVLDKAIKSTEKILNETNIKIFIMEHHPYRDLDYKEKLKEYFSIFEKRGLTLLNYALFLNKEEMLLEGERELFYEKPFRFNKPLW